MTPQIPHAAQRRPLHSAGQLGQDALDWFKTNFYKTELELGHCLRLPQEGPCECDLYLTCAKFVTTPSTRRGSANACAWRGNWPTTPRSAAGTVQSTVTSSADSRSADGVTPGQARLAAAYRRHMDVIQLLPRLYFLRFPVGHAYLWHDPDGLTLIDTGLPGSAPLIAGAIREAGYQPTFGGWC
jgi:hypothetical protein